MKHSVINHLLNRIYCSYYVYVEELKKHQIRNNLKYTVKSVNIVSIFFNDVLYLICRIYISIKTSFKALLKAILTLDYMMH